MRGDQHRPLCDLWDDVVEARVDVHVGVELHDARCVVTGQEQAEQRGLERARGDVRRPPGQPRIEAAAEDLVGEQDLVDVGEERAAAGVDMLAFDQREGQLRFGVVRLQ